MINKSLNSLFGFAAKEGANRVIISNSESGPSFTCHMPNGEEAVFSLPKKLENDLSSNIRQVLKIAPSELLSQKYYKFQNKDFRLHFNLSIIPDKHGEKIVINVLGEESETKKLSGLGFQKDELKLIRQEIKAKSGLIIIASSARQGRTSTLNSLLNELDTEKKNIYFIGNSKIKITGINYLEDSTKNWNSVISHDSDIVAADNDDNKAAYIKKAVLTSSTGRMVIIAVEAVNAIEAFYKVLNCGAPLNLVLENLRMIVGQELVNLKRQKSKTERGKIGIFEIFKLDKKIKLLILDNEDRLAKEIFWKKLFQEILRQGFKPMKADAEQKRTEGLIS